MTKISLNIFDILQKYQDLSSSLFPILSLFLKVFNFISGPMFKNLGDLAFLILLWNFISISG